MLFKYMAIVFLVGFCVAHNGRRGGPPGRSHGPHSPGCRQPSHNYKSRDNHYTKEYHHQPRKKQVYYEEPPRQRVLTLVEDVVYTIIKPICDKEPIKYEHKHEECKKENRKTYIEDTQHFYDEYDDYRQRPHRTRNTEVRRSYFNDDYRDDYGDIQRQPPRRTNRDKGDNNKQRRSEEPIKREKCTNCNQQRRKDGTNVPNNINDRPNTNRNGVKKQHKKSNKRPSDYYDDFPDDGFPDDNVQRPNRAYDQYEYSYYEDYTGFAF